MKTYSQHLKWWTRRLLTAWGQIPREVYFWSIRGTFERIFFNLLALLFLVVAPLLVVFSPLIALFDMRQQKKISEQNEKFRREMEEHLRGLAQKEDQ